MERHRPVVASPIQQQGLNTRKYAILDGPFSLEGGSKIGPITCAYDTYGELNETKDNVILICHALTGDAFVSGTDDKGNTGWWDPVIGPGKVFDTDKYYIICINVLGGCQGTTGPASINPETGKPWGISFPVITIKDMVRVQYELLNFLGISKIKIVIGGSMGGMLVLEWAIMYPEMVENMIPIATSTRLSPFGIAFNEVGRQAIKQDPQWKNGDYYPSLGPIEGLALARMIATITYKSENSFSFRFGRNTVTPPNQLINHDSFFEVESYLRYQGKKLTKRFDANCYLYLLKAMDLHDISRGYGSLEKSLARFQGNTLVIGIDSDFIYPTHEQKQIIHLLKTLDKQVDYFEIKSPYGHDAFLIEFDQLSRGIGRFIKKF